MLQLKKIGVLIFFITFAYGLAAKDASSLSNDLFSLNALHNHVDETSNSDDFDFFADGEPDMGEDANSDLEVTSDTGFVSAFALNDSEVPDTKTQSDIAKFVDADLSARWGREEKKIGEEERMRDEKEVREEEVAVHAGRCTDDPGWKQYERNKPTYDCKDYESKGWCHYGGTRLILEGKLTNIRSRCAECGGPGPKWPWKRAPYPASKSDDSTGKAWNPRLVTRGYTNKDAAMNVKNAQDACCVCGKIPGLDFNKFNFNDRNAVLNAGTTYTYKQGSWKAKLSGWTHASPYGFRSQTYKHRRWTESGKAVIEGLNPGRKYKYKIYQKSRYKNWRYWSVLNKYTVNGQSKGSTARIRWANVHRRKDQSQVTVSSSAVADHSGKLTFVFKPGLNDTKHLPQLSGIRIANAGDMYEKPKPPKKGQVCADLSKAIENRLENSVAALAKQWKISKDQAKDCALGICGRDIKDTGKLKMALERKGVTSFTLRTGGLYTKTWLFRRFGTHRPCCHCDLDSEKQFRHTLGNFRRMLKALGYPKEVLRELKGVEDCVKNKCKRKRDKLNKRDKLKTPAPSKKSTWGARRLLQQTQDQPLVELANTAILANPTGATLDEFLDTSDGWGGGVSC